MEDHEVVPEMIGVDAAAVLVAEARREVTQAAQEILAKAQAEARELTEDERATVKAKFAEEGARLHQAATEMSAAGLLGDLRRPAQERVPRQVLQGQAMPRGFPAQRVADDALDRRRLRPGR